MEPVHGLVLGIVQGLTEFLPISSSAHLVLVPWLLGWPEHSLTFDVALHMGTLAALLGYFWRDWWSLVAAWLPEPGAKGERQEAPGEGAGADDRELAAARRARRRLGLSLIIGTVPAALIGAVLADRVEEALRAPATIALLLLAAGVLLIAADRAGVQWLGLGAIGVWHAIIIGLAQALALAPGVSRSGITLAAGLFLGLSREASARYGFLLAVPITAGAGVFQLRHLLGGGIPANERAAFALGVLASLVVGMAAIGGFLRYVRHRSLDVFVAYRVVVALLVLAAAALRVR